MTVDEQTFRTLHAQRAREWRAAAQAWVLGGAEVAAALGPYLIFVHSSEGQIERFLLPHLEEVQVFGGFPVQGSGSARGRYRGVEIWLVHQYMGCTATQLWMECLADTPVRYVIGLAEMTAYPASVRIGDIVLPTLAVRGDGITDLHLPPEVPATADPDLLARLEARLRPAGWPLHVGPVYSGMPGGVGIDNPILRLKVWDYLQAGLLGNAIEVSVTYAEAMRLDLRAAAAWAVSDDVAVGTFAQSEGGEARWARAWELIAKAALDVLADLADEAQPSR